MSIFKKLFIFWLCVSFFCFHLPYISATAVAGVTTQKPQVISSPEEDIPVEETQPSKKGGGKWLWALLGAALIGGVVAAAGGGGSSGGGDGDDGGDTGDGDGGSTASYEFSW